jgi:glycosyltransferase involved in cell wall biosynthesis
MRIICLGFPHVLTLDPRDPDGQPEQFAELIWNFCAIMAARGHDVIHVGAAGSQLPPGVTVVDVPASLERAACYTDAGKERTPGCAAGYRRRFADEARALLLDLGGRPYSSVIGRLWDSDGATANVPQFVCEYGIGYPHASAPYRIYLSHAWRHFSEGQANNTAGNHWYWQVIPLPVDMSLFGPVEASKGDYLLYMGRMADDKGVLLAVQLAKAAGIPIRLAGRGDGARFVAEWPEGAQHVGAVTVAQRRELLRHARALLCPTRYVEPLGAVALEAQASGCPVICTDWGGFTETVVHADADDKHGTGWRCSTFEEFLWAVRNVHKIDPHACREWIERNHSFEHVGAAYEDYLQSLLRLGKGGWTESGAANDRTGLPRAFRDYSMFGH